MAIQTAEQAPIKLMVLTRLASDQVLHVFLQSLFCMCRNQFAGNACHFWQVALAMKYLHSQSPSSWDHILGYLTGF